MKIYFTNTKRPDYHYYATWNVHLKKRRFYTFRMVKMFYACFMKYGLEK